VLKIKYEFGSPRGLVRNYVLLLDSNTLKQHEQLPRESSLPNWAALDCFQCSNCPLNTSSHPHCPLAVSLSYIVPICQDLNSFDEIDIRVSMSERTVTSSTTIQRALSSLLGLIVATSSCPHTKFLRPMARFHLPLATEEETFYRSASMYLLAQYFLYRSGHTPDIALNGLAVIYQNIQIINRAMVNRLRIASKEDGTINAIILLDLFAKAFPQAIEDSLEDMRYLFKPYFDALE